MTGRHLAASEAMKLRSACGELASASSPAPRSFSCTSLDARACVSARLSSSTTAAGVPLGASNAIHTSMSGSLIPTSAIDGTLGSVGMGLALRRASGRSVPFSKWGMAVVIVTSLVSRLWVVPALPL